jgi:hypothetical protein
MSDDPDFPKAEHALQVLRQARLARNETAAIMVEDLAYETANTGLRDPEIEQAHQAAWVAISALGECSQRRRVCWARYLESSAESYRELERAVDLGSRCPRSDRPHAIGARPVTYQIQRRGLLSFGKYFIGRDLVLHGAPSNSSGDQGNKRPGERACKTKPVR